MPLRNTKSYSSSRSCWERAASSRREEYLCSLCLCIHTDYLVLLPEEKWTSKVSGDLYLNHAKSASKSLLPHDGVSEFSSQLWRLCPSFGPVQTPGSSRWLFKRMGSCTQVRPGLSPRLQGSAWAGPGQEGGIRGLSNTFEFRKFISLIHALPLPVALAVSFTD